MKRYTLSAILFSFAMLHCISIKGIDIKPYHVVWDTPSENSWGSMPIGNGDVGANVWVNPQGELEFYISKTDAFSEINQLLKIGKLTVTVSSDILAKGRFKQELDLYNGIIRIAAWQGVDSLFLNFWVDANQPVIHVEGTSSSPIEIKVTNNMWRNQKRLIAGGERHAIYGLYSAPFDVYADPDLYVEDQDNMVWVHHNQSSIYLQSLENQGLDHWKDKPADPLLNNVFGALVTGGNLKKQSAESLISVRKEKNIDLSVYVHSQAATTVEKWYQSINSLKKKGNKTSLNTLRKNHIKWWNRFWNQHYILIESEEEPQEAFLVTQKYMLQRYITACSGRGKMPIKFNGSIFTVDLQQNLGNGKKGYDADYRDWGGPYWWQNTRLPYYTMLYSGDVAMMKPLFAMYMKALPLATYRTRTYFNHGGGFFPETFCFWGTYAMDNYGWERAGMDHGLPVNNYIKIYYQSNIEVVSMMLDYYEFTRDEPFLKETLLPFAREIITFYDEHYQRKEEKLYIYPAQSLETFFEGVSNPMPDVAGLKWILTRLKRLSPHKVGTEFYTRITTFLEEVPAFPTLVHEGKRMISAGYNLGERKNVEKPELYAVFPYRWFGVGMDHIDWAVNAYEQRAVKEYWGWQQDGIFAANLGLTQEAKRIVTANYQSVHKASRFPGFYGPNYDWLPDQDHGTVTSRALQNMLIQTDNERVFLLPAWPDEWRVKFKLHLPDNGLIEGSYNAINGVNITNQQLKSATLIQCKK